MLSTIDSLQTLLKASGADSATTFQLEDLLRAADRSVKAWTKQDLEAQIVTDYYDGTGRPQLWLRQRPVNLVVQTGTLTSGSPTVTGLTDTSRIVAGMPAVSNRSSGNPLPAGTTVLTTPATGATTVTLSANATASGSYTVFFGLAVYEDQAGFGGQGVNSPFASTSQLFIGDGYLLDTDRPDGSSKSGTLTRLAGTFSGVWPSWPTEMRRGTLTAPMPPIWPKGYRNVKVVASVGYLPGSPELIELGGCVNALAAYMLRTWPLGGTAVQSESVQGWSYSAAQLALGQAPELGTVRQTLTRYRDFSI